MNQEERARLIIAELMEIPKENWERSYEGGQGFFTAIGHSGLALYFSEAMLDLDSEHPESDDAIECYLRRLGDAPYAVEVWDESHCVCLLRFSDLENIEVVEYEHGPWEIVSFSLPAKDRSHQPTAH